MTRRHLLLLAGALLVGLLVRLPGVWWGANFPPGWYGHHPDEYTHTLNTQLLINRYQPAYNPATSEAIGMNNPWAAGYSVTPYPKGMAAHVAVPVKILGKLTGASAEPPPSATIIPAGRMVSVLYGAATILVVFMLALRLTGNTATALLAAWIIALCGIHVTQSHFFLADVPALFWLLLGTLLLWYDLQERDTGRPTALAGAAFCFGVAFGLKLLVAGLPSLGLVALARKGRIWRVILAGVFTQFGLYAVNIGFYTPLDFYQTVARGIADPFLFSTLASVMLYLIELPSLLSLPVAIAAIGGIFLLAARLLSNRYQGRYETVFLVILLPLLTHLALLLFKLDHFPRHLLPFIPWLVIVAAWAIVGICDRYSNRYRTILPLTSALLVVYLAVFVADGEKGFLKESRNDAANWLYENIPAGTSLWWYYHNLPEYPRMDFPTEQPDVIVEEMIHANHYLSGVGLRDSMPRDYRYIFDINSQESADAFQSLFSGESEYIEAARFDENYFMPEYVLTDKIIGNRSRNYLTEVVIFVKRDLAGKISGN
jgi:hypothetical protein